MYRKAMVLVLVIMMVALSGCEAIKRFKGKRSFDKLTSSYSEMEGRAPSSAMKSMAAGEAKSDGMLNSRAADVKAEPAEMQRKIIYSAYLNLEVEAVMKAMDGLEDVAKKFNGYVSNSSTKKYDNRSKSGSATLRIPTANLDNAIADVKALGDAMDESKSGEDITKKYYDLEARLKNSRAFEKRILKLLQTRTNKIADVLEVERELSRVREKIETAQGTLRYYKNKVELSTLSVRLYEKGVDLPKGPNWLQSIINTFAAALGSFFTSLGEITIIVFALAPWVFFIGLVIYLFIRVRRKRAS